MFFITLPIM